MAVVGQSSPGCVMLTARDEASPLLRAILNLAAFHRDHEKFSAAYPANRPSARTNATGAHRPVDRCRLSGG
jgi:hypothetical protein